MSEVPDPGSAEAVKQGCKCPVIDNHRGRGFMGIPGRFVIMGNCPLHASMLDELPKRDIPDDETC